MPKNPRHKVREVRRAEPAMIRGAVVAVLGLLATLGFTWAEDVSKETIGYIVAVGVVVIPLVQAAWTRFAVTPADPPPPGSRKILGKAVMSPSDTRPTERGISSADLALVVLAVGFTLLVLVLTGVVR